MHAPTHPHPRTHSHVRARPQALEAIDELTQHVDILIVVSNDKLLDIVPEGVPLQA